MAALWAGLSSLPADHSSTDPLRSSMGNPDAFRQRVGMACGFAVGCGHRLISQPDNERNIAAVMIEHCGRDRQPLRCLDV